MTLTYIATPIGIVHSPRTDVLDDDWGDVESTIEIDDTQFTSEVLDGLSDFSHVDVIFFFDRVSEASITLGSRHPRNREDWPRVGIFAQRARVRPNRLGTTTCKLVSVDGLTITVRGLDAIHGTPVLDIKPHVIEFQARGPVTQPDWIGELMSTYW